MLQFYFLSIVTDLTVAFLLIIDGKFGETGTIESFISSRPFKLTLSILSLFTSLILALSPASGVIILGDFFPVLAGVLGGLTLLQGVFSEEGAEMPRVFERLSFLREKKRATAFALIVVAVLHFISPEAPLL